MASLLHRQCCLVATVIHLRHDLPHADPGLLFDADRSAITRATGQLRTLLAERGSRPQAVHGVRLRTVEDVVAYARADGVELRLDATEAQVRRPRTGRGGRRVFVSGKKKHNTSPSGSECAGVRYHPLADRPQGVCSGQDGGQGAQQHARQAVAVLWASEDPPTRRAWR